MNLFAKQAVRQALLGLLLGASTALVVQLGSGFTAAMAGFVKAHVRAITGAADFKLLTGIIAIGLLLYSAPQIATFLEKLSRSWLAGIITGISPIWFLLSLVLFLRFDSWGVLEFLLFAAGGLLPIMASGLVVRCKSTRASDSSISIPRPAPVPDDLLVKREITFDLPIHSWSEDRLNRGPFIQSVADLILLEKAPVIGIVGPFGEGKTSALKLIDTCLGPRKDLIVVNFSSWLPGDELTLALSLFGTIAKQIRSRYLMPLGLSAELNKFARLLAGTVPRFGETLKQIFQEPSQVEQLRKLTRRLRELPVRVVVLVDELDRMDKAELHLLLKAIRGVVDLPNITYVCAFDRKAVARLVSDANLFDGQSYLEKFFPVQLALPRTDQELLGKIFDDKLEGIIKTFELLPTERDKKAFNEVLLPLWHTSIKRYLSNFRRMTLFFNAFQMALRPVYAEVDLYDMMVLQLVKMVSEEAYEFIYDNGPLFYFSSWRLTLWMEQLSVDDKVETAIRDRRLNAFFDSLPSPTKARVTDLLRMIFPTVDQCLRGGQFSSRMPSSRDAELKRRICHPDYFPRYFINQVPLGMFGRGEMADFITQMNAQEGVQRSMTVFRGTLDKLASNPWKRWSFLDTLVAAAAGLSEDQSEALVLGIAAISDSLESDFLGISEWGRARAALFAAVQRLSGTSKSQQVLDAAIRQATSDGFAADILRYTTTMRNQNDIVTDWENVDEVTIRKSLCRANED